MPAPTFRPYLTLNDIQVIVAALKYNPSSEHLKLIRKMELYCFKISTEHLASSYTPALSMAEKLELDGPEPKLDHAEIRKEAYKKWTANPDSCTSVELMRAQEYMFENDLMSPEQEAMFLSSSQGK
jgi:hypothetical protein